MSTGLEGPSLPLDEAGEELWGLRAGAGSLLGDPACAGGQYPPGGTAGAESGSQAEQSRLRRGAAFGVSPAPLWAGQEQGVPRGRPSQPYWEPPQGCPAARELGMISSRGVRVLFQALGMAFRGAGDIGVSPEARSACYGRGCLGTAGLHAGRGAAEP